MTRAAWGMVALAVFLLGGPAAAAVQAGVSAAVRGQVDLLPIVEKVKRQVESGEDVFLGDEISSFDDSGMQIMLLDETVFTIGPNTDLTVDEFVYDPATGAGRVTASLAKGVLRFVTGKVAEASPQNTVIKLPVGTIGIRGTFGAALYDGERALVVLLGPGLDNNADARVGRLAVSAGGVTVELARTRFGTIIEPGQPPSPPFELSDAQLASILSGLAPESAEPPKKSPSVGSASTDAGEDTAQALQPIVSTILTDENLVLQDQAGEQAATTAFISDITTIGELFTLSGQAQYTLFSGPFVQTIKNGSPVNIVGDIEASFDINFGTRIITGSIDVDTLKFGGGGNIDSGSLDAQTIVTIDYSSDTGLAAGIFEPSELSNLNFLGSGGALINSDGIIANQATVNVIYNDSLNNNAGSGSATSGPRQPL